ncbi:hypothetical protein [Labrenzia sp. OB1]|uniref:hypothetical protein n=1 Tax=Labrenzia sp. OB1 TaxID=1561204 RepID=UPI000ACCA2C0|nr:hypothetical protein [Labrenzia sp. OB1]
MTVVQLRAAIRNVHLDAAVKSQSFINPSKVVNSLSLNYLRANIMKTFFIVLFAALCAQANAQSIDSTIVEDGLLGIPSAEYFLRERRGIYNLVPRDSAINKFCSGYSDAAVAMVLSSRITRDEADRCYQSGATTVTEVFDRYRGYVYFNLEAEPRELLEQYRIWTDPNLQIDQYDLHRYLNRDRRLLPGILQTNAPETCTGENQLACADGEYCCNGTCIPNDEVCN